MLKLSNFSIKMLIVRNYTVKVLKNGFFFSDSLGFYPSYHQMN